MATTIQVSEQTHQLLKHLKGKDGRSYDAIIREMLRKQLRIPQSLAGAYPELNKARAEPTETTERLK